MPGYGSAGKSLGDAATKRQFGKNADIGAAGERAYMQTLRKAGLTDIYDVHASLRIPQAKGGGGTRYSSDVDFAVANGNRLILVDVKRWASGFHYWSFMGFPFKNLVPMMKGGKWRMSANMAGALARYRDNLPGVHVEGLVVFVATNNRGAMPASVGFLRWPGGIPSALSGDSIHRIRRVLGKKAEPVDPKIKSLLGRMTR